MPATPRSRRGSSGGASIGSAATAAYKQASRALVDFKSSSTVAATEAASKVTQGTSLLTKAIASFSSTPSREATADDEKLAYICAVGFSPEEAQRALSRFGGNLGPACNLLFEERDKGDKAASDGGNGDNAASDASTIDKAASDGGCYRTDSSSTVCMHAASSNSLSSSAEGSSCTMRDSASPEANLNAALLADDDEEVLWELPGLKQSRQESALPPPPSSPLEPRAAPCEPVALIGTLSVATDVSEGANDGVDDCTAEAACDDIEQCTNGSCSEEGAVDSGSEGLLGMLVHPDGEAWDWPLSCEEKKSRIVQLERLEQELDKRELIQELVDLRIFKRRSAAGSRRHD